jgi:hypothetical protein
VALPCLADWPIFVLPTRSQNADKTSCRSFQLQTQEARIGQKATLGSPAARDPQQTFMQFIGCSAKVEVSMSFMGAIAN